MTHTEQLIQDGLRGDFSPFLNLATNELKCRLEGDLFVCSIKGGDNRDPPPGTCTVCIEKILMQPEFWQAVGSIRGWALHPEDADKDHPYWKVPAGVFWQKRMHGRAGIAQLHIDRCDSTMKGRIRLLARPGVLQKCALYLKKRSGRRLVLLTRYCLVNRLKLSACEGEIGGIRVAL